MKRLTILLLLGLSSAFGASPVGLVPEDKTALVVADTERNPFGKKMLLAEAAAPVSENEELRIRAIVETMSVGGVTQGRTGTKVLLGTMVVEEGRTIPPVIPNQKEKIKLLAVSNDQLELAFIEKDGNAGARKIFIPLSIAPKVQYKLAKPAVKHPAPEEGGGFDGVISKDELSTPQ